MTLQVACETLVESLFRANSGGKVTLRLASASRRRSEVNACNVRRISLFRLMI